MVNRPNDEPRVAVPDAIKKNPVPRGKQKLAVTLVSWSGDDSPSMYPKLPPPGPKAVAFRALKSNLARVDAPWRCRGNTANTSTSVHGSLKSRTARALRESEVAASSASATGRAHTTRSSAAAKQARRAMPDRDIADMARIPPRVRAAWYARAD